MPYPLPAWPTAGRRPNCDRLQGVQEADRLPPRAVRELLHADEEAGVEAEEEAMSQLRRWWHCLLRWHRPADALNDADEKVVIGCRCGRVFWSKGPEYSSWFFVRLTLLDLAEGGSGNIIEPEKRK